MTPAGTEWLAHCALSPTTVQAQWSAEELAPVRTTAWSVVETHDIVQAADVLLALRRTGHAGPVLAYPEGRQIWWLLPPGQAAAFDGFPGLTVRPADWALPCPPADEPLHGHGWLEKPDGTGHLTHPAHLSAALTTTTPNSTETPTPPSPTIHHESVLK
ncbi:hypothetical protein I5Q34_30995 [Streptomyces sp. AV19]|uniref:hypothetical protein n=1 Tax=Streptomyces sp. AV19 TaxID=2793068 RepID=UPI0018FEC63D|nr:hypothetical protein [Streptomyces sp. AV19]MBH1938636.1 hypothetical protein [Streptomyces sp. AV19]MDG4535348.1 hypothetical protein [Streptomyces sp. AV19]